MNTQDNWTDYDVYALKAPENSRWLGCCAAINDMLQRFLKDVALVEMVRDQMLKASAGLAAEKKKQKSTKNLFCCR